MEFLLRYVDHINLWQLGKRFKKIAVFLSAFLGLIRCTVLLEA